MSSNSILLGNLNSPRPHSRWFHWRRRLILAGFAIGMVLGTWGYLQLKPSIRFIDAVYYALQQFLTHAPLLTDTIPWKLEIARWVAAATTFLTACQLLEGLYREERNALRISKLKDHTIICGLGEKGLAVALRLQMRGAGSGHNRVLVIEKNPTAENLVRCHKAGILVLQGDATDRATLVSDLALNKLNHWQNWSTAAGWRNVSWPTGSWLRKRTSNAGRIPTSGTGMMKS